MLCNGCRLAVPLPSMCKMVVTSVVFATLEKHLRSLHADAAQTVMLPLRQADTSRAAGGGAAAAERAAAATRALQCGRGRRPGGRPPGTRLRRQCNCR